MKHKTISLKIVKNFGQAMNYETVHMEVETELDPTDTIDSAFKVCKEELMQSFNAMYPEYMANRSQIITAIPPEKKNLTDAGTPPPEKKNLMIGTKEFDMICTALKDSRTDVQTLEQHYTLSTDVIKYFIEHGLYTPREKKI